MFGDLVSKEYKLCVEAVLSDSYCYKPTCYLNALNLVLYILDGY